MPNFRALIKRLDEPVYDLQVTLHKLAIIGENKLGNEAEHAKEYATNLAALKAVVAELEAVELNPVAR